MKYRSSKEVTTKRRQRDDQLNIIVELVVLKIYKNIMIEKKLKDQFESRRVLPPSKKF